MKRAQKAAFANTAFAQVKNVETLACAVFKPEMLGNVAFVQKDGALKTLFKTLHSKKRMPLWGRVAAMHLTNAMKHNNGEAAVAWRDELFDMLLHKELLLARPECSAESAESESQVPGVDLNAQPSSLTRAFALQYLEWLPPNEELSKGTQEGLVQYLIIKLLEFNLTHESMQIMMGGTMEYCVKVSRNRNNSPPHPHILPLPF